MLTRSGHGLPAELYSLIFSHLDLHDVVQLSRTCHVLFNATLRDIWRVVQLRPLLALLPGSCIVTGSRGQSEPKAPKFGMTSEDYYARFGFYAPYVEVLKTEPWSYLCAPSKYFIDRRTYSSLHRIELPALKEVDMGYAWSNTGWVLGGAYDKPSLFWMALLIPPTLKSISFTATDRRDLSLLGTLLARCSRVTRFRFRPDQRPNWDTWLTISAFNIPQEITSLEVYCTEVSKAGFSWLSKLPRLQSLELLLSQNFSQSPQRGLPNTSSNPPVAYTHAFSALRNLSISVTEKDKLQGAMQVWHTIATNVTHFTVKAPGRIWTPDTFDNLFVGFPSHCSKATFLHFHEVGAQSYGSDVLPFPVSHFSILRPLPLQVLRIGFPLDLVDDPNPLKSLSMFFPDLEELWLEKTPIRINELLYATLYFPNIRRLEISFQVLKPTPNSLSDSLGIGSQHDSDYAPGSTLVLKLELQVYKVNGHEKGLWAYDSEDWDFAARSLVSRWSSVSIKTSLSGTFPEICRNANDRFTSHSARRARPKNAHVDGNDSSSA